ncbi:GTPase IMAP family member 8-like [Synchiropus picturatus]
MAQKSAEEEAAELRLVLMGMTGGGKSSCGNTILGEKKFKACFCGSSVTRCCQLERAELLLEESSGQRKRTVSVVDGPGFGDTDLTAEEVQIEISKCVSLSSPGPHAFLLVVPVGRYTEHQNQAVTQMAQIFGEGAIRDHTVVLFTRGDDLEDSDIESFLRLMAPNALRELVSRCGRRFHVFNNKDTRSSEQVRVLLEKVDRMVEQRGFYTSVVYQAAEAAIREEEERLKRETEEEEQQGGAQAGQPAADDQQQSTAAGGGCGGGASQERTPARLLLEIRREAARSPLVQGIIRSLVLAITKGIVDVNDLGVFDRTRPARRRASGAGSDSVVRAGGPTLPDPAVSVEDLVAQVAHIGVRGVNTLVERLVLMGNTGGGKSSCGNTILGEKKFTAGCSATSVTRCCQLESAELLLEESSGQRKRTVSVVDCPGFGDTDLTAEEVQIEISKCVSLSSPGPHAFLLVVPVGRYTEHQNQAVTQMARIFGEGAIRDHTVVLFTRGDELEDTSIESFLRQTASDALRDLVNRCGGRFHVFNNKDTSSSEQVRVLLEKVDHMVEQRGFYTSAMYQAAEAAIREEEERLKREKEEEQRALCMRARKRAADVISTGDSQPLLGAGGEHGSHQERSQLRSQAAHSPTVLDKIKAIVPAIAAGLVVGAALGALTPLAAAGCVAGVAVEVAVGSLVTVASGNTAVLCGAAVGGVVGGVVGVLDADNLPRSVNVKVQVKKEKPPDAFSMNTKEQ